MKTTTKSSSVRLSCAIAAACCVLALGRAEAGTWQELPVSNLWGGEQIVLLSDGTVVFQGGSSPSSMLHPDALGNYATGTWTTRNPSPYASWCCPSETLNDGTWMYYGGEYNPQNPSASEIYNPGTGAWTIGISAVSGNVADSFNVMLANGLVLNNALSGTEEYNWQTGSWNYINTALSWGDEANVELLPDGDVFDPLWSQQFNPATNTWFSVPAGPVSDTGDPGPAIECYNGQVLVENTTNQMMFYIPSTTPGQAGTWSSNVITLPSGISMGDTNSTLEPNGNVLIGATHVYELNPSTLAITDLSSSIGGDFLTLPNGQCIVSNGPNIWIYTPTGSPSSSWRPTVTSVTGTGPFTLTGKQLFGLSQCSTDNDDSNTAENYPIVYLKSGSNVWYCRSYNYSTRSIAPGSASETCQFSLPPGLPAGSYKLYVSVNGISSASSYSFMAPAAPAVCISTGQQYILTPSSSGSYPMNSNTSGYPEELVGGINSSDYWTAVQNSNGTYTIFDSVGTVLDGNGVTTSGGNVITNTSNGSVNQEWTITPVAGGYYEIANKNSGLALDGGTGPGANQAILQDTYTGASGEKWGASLAYTAPSGIISGNVYVPTPSSSGAYPMNYYGGFPAEWNGNVDSNDYWTATSNANGTYTLTDSMGTVLDGNGVTTSGGAVVTNTSNGGSNQQWLITSLSGGLYEITNKTSGLALDGGTGPGNNQAIVQTTYTGASGQKWNLSNMTVNGFVVTYEPGLIPMWGASASGIPQQADLEQNASMSFPVSVLANTENGGTVGTVTFSASGLPPGMKASFSPASITGTGTTTCTLTASTPALGTYTVTITGVGTGASLGITEGQRMHVNVLGSVLSFGASVAAGTYSLVNEGQTTFPTLGSNYKGPGGIALYGAGGSPQIWDLGFSDTGKQWTVTPVGNYYSIVNVADGLALTASSSTTVTQAAYTGAASQLWWFSQDGTGFSVQNEAYGTTLDATTNSLGSSPVLDAWTSGALHQAWILTSNIYD